MKKRTTADTLVINLNHLMSIFEMDSEKVAKKSGLTSRAINYYLKGERVPSIEKAEQLAAAFGLEGWHLIMPNLPKDIKETKHLNKLIDNYTEATKEGKQLIDMVAEREAKYAHE